MKNKTNEEVLSYGEGKIEALQNDKNDLNEAKTELETQIDQIMAERNERVSRRSSNKKSSMKAEKIH